MRFPNEHGERNHYDCGDTYESNFPADEPDKPFTPAEFQERIKRQLMPPSLSDWLDDKRALEAGSWDAEQSAEHAQQLLQQETDNN